MKLLIMCEGPNEKKIVDLLLDHDCLKHGIDDLLDLQIFHARQIATSPQVRIALNLYPEEVTVIRIGDTQTDKLKIPDEYKDKIVEVQKYCTKPELEILLIISENLLKEYEKQKTYDSPKEFAKARIKVGKRKYDNSTQFYSEYYGSNIQGLVNSIKEYQRVHEKGLFANHTMRQLLDELDVIECYEAPGNALVVGEVLKKQEQLYIALGVTPLLAKA